MKKFVPKEGHEVINYNGYVINIDLNKEVKIYEQLSTGKFKMRRSIMGSKAGHDCFGNQLYYTISGVEAIEKAKKFIDEHITPFELK